MLQKNTENNTIVCAKIIDFGLSKIVLPDEHLQECCGTPAFTAPEIVDKQGYGKEVDIWSAGCLLYTIVSGQLLFETPSSYFSYKQTEDLS